MGPPEVIGEQDDLKTPEVVQSGSESPPNWNDLRTYTRAKQAIANVVRRLDSHFRHSDDELRAAACRDLMVKLAEDRFTLAVLGQFNRGKSSLMNAIMGRQILPTGVLPLTSAITVLRFGSCERLVIERKGWSLPETAPFSALPNYVTQQGNPGNEKKVERVYVELPLPFLRRGLEFVDTPGVGSAVDANTATTMEFLPRCDAALFVTSVDTPLTAVETDLLSKLRGYVRKIIFIINKTDLLDDQERQQVVTYIIGALQRQMGTSSLRVFAASSKKGLKAKLAGDSEAYKESGLGPLEEAITSFLAVEKSSSFLMAILDKAAAIASRELQELDAARQAQGIPPETLEQKLSQLQDRFRQLKQDRDRDLAELRQRARQSATTSLDREFAAFVSAQMPTILAQLEREVSDASGWSSNAANLAADRVLRGFWEKVTEWINSLGPRLETEINQATRPARAPLENQLAAIPSAAVSVTGGGPREDIQKAEDAEPLPSLDLPPLALRKPQWTPKIPGTLRYTPVSLGRRRVQDCLRKQFEEAVAACRAEASKAVDRAVNQAVDQLASAVQDLAGRTESRLLTAISSQACKAAWPADHSSADVCPASGRERIVEIQQSISSLRDAILRHDPAEQLPGALDLGPAAVVPSAPSPAEAEPEATRSELPDVRSELQRWGCPLCNHLIDTAFEFYRHFQYRLSADETTQRLFAEQLGLCPLHTWQLAAISSPQGLSVGFPKLLERVSAILSGLLDEPSEMAGRVAALVPTGGSCQVCGLLRAEEHEHVARLLQFLGQPVGRDTYVRGHGFCLRHLAALLAASPPADLATFLLGEAVRRFDQLSEDMQSYAIKRDAIRSGLLTGDEEQAYLRALVRLAGHQGLCGVWPPGE